MLLALLSSVSLGAGEPPLNPLLGHPAKLFVTAANRRASSATRRAALELLIHLGEAARPHVRSQTEAADLSAQRTALALLGEIGTSQDASRLVRACASEDPFLCSTGQAALSSLYRRHPGAWMEAKREGAAVFSATAPPAPPARDLIALLDATPGRPAEPVWSPAEKKTLATWTQAEEAGVAAAACRALRPCAAEPACRNALLAALHTHGTARVRQAAADVLAATEAASPQDWKVALADLDNTVRRTAAIALARRGEDAGLQALLALAREAGPSSEAMGKLGEGAHPLQLRRLDPGRLAALAALAKLGNPHLETPLETFLRDPHWQIRAAAARALGALQGRSLSPALRAALVDPHPQVRAAAALALAAQGALGLQWRFVEDLTHAEASVRHAAAVVLGELGTAQTLPLLAPAARDDSPEVALAVIKALAALGSRDRPTAVEALRPGLRDVRLPIAAASALALETLTQLPFTRHPGEALTRLDTLAH